MKTACYSCKRPNDTVLAQQLAEGIANEDYWTLYAMHPVMQMVYEHTYKDTFNEKRNEKEAFIYGTRKCKSQGIDWKKGNHVMDLSTCPWYLELTYDEDRFPAIMTTTRCRCKICYTQEGSRPKNTKGQPKCHPIYIRQLVLRKSYVDSDLNAPVCTYNLSYQKVGVGCTCKLRRLDSRSQSSSIHKPGA
ncbi:hypothetical protein DPMN_010281 [Dreissena polymorpha]|uniref:Uncharacterized protein n=1 Tax=Dreissena polymorpha TaxID=45954 RepID=A0A9D4N2W2_DREPO|nr:hypothetical protein DPMN_010281 [Dreissena polymorpha]